jgi:hypothetical protein
VPIAWDKEGKKGKKKSKRVNNHTQEGKRLHFDFE